MKSLRTLIWAAMIAAAGTLPAQAQTVESFGAFGGFSRASSGGSFIDLIKDVGGVVNPRYGLTLGGFANLSLAPNTIARAELGLSQRGFRVPPENGLRRRELDLTYVTLAGLARRSFPGESVNPWIGAGPVISIRASANGTIDDSSNDVSDEMSSTDFGFALEAGATRDVLDFGVRYVVGLSNVSSSSDSDEGFKNRGLAFTVSYLIPR